VASGAGSQTLVESDFLFGLRESDVHHAHVLKALELHKSGEMAMRVSSSSVIEVQTVLHSRGLASSVVEDALSLMGGILALHGVRDFVPIELGDAVLSERLRADHRGLGFFDSLHAAVCQRLQSTMLSSEGVYETLGLRVVDLDKL
jgi:hypothetical protein